MRAGRRQKEKAYVILRMAAPPTYWNAIDLLNNTG
jgi:hypothetical protein